MPDNHARYPDHRRNTEDLLTKLAGLLHGGDPLAEELRLARRRRTAARHLIAHRVIAGRLDRGAA